MRNSSSVRNKSMSKVSNFYNGVYVAILILIACSVALAILPSAFNYVLIKLVIAQFFLIIIFIIWLYQTLERGEITIHKDPAYLPLVFLLGWSILSFFFSSFGYASIEEIGRLLTYFFLYFAVVNWIKKEKDLISVVVFILIVCSALSVHGLFYYLKEKTSVITSTFGNQNFFSAYLILLLPLIILIVIYNWRRKNFLFASLMFILTGIIVFLVRIMDSQGAFLGIGASLLFLIVLFRRQIFKPKVRVLFFSGLFALLLLGTVLSVPKLPQIKAYINSEIESGTIGIRLKIWQGSLRMIKERPLTGWGTGTFYLVYPNFRIPEYFLNPHSVNATRHAHNELLEITAETGIVGVGFFLWLLATIFSRGVKTFYRNSLNLVNIIHAGLLAGIVALFTQNLTGVNFRFSASSIYFYLFLGLISVGCNFYQTKEEGNFFKKKFPKKKALGWFILPIAILLGVIYTETTISLVRSSIHLKSGITFRNSKMWEEAIAEYNKAIHWDHYNLKAYYRLAYAYAEINKPNEALTVYLQLKELAPDYADIHYNLGSLYLRSGRWEDAKEELQRAVEQNPYGPKTHCNLGAVYMRLGESDNAIAEYKHAISVHDEKKRINPKLADFGGGYMGLGDIYYSQKQWEEASQNYKKVVQSGKKNAKIFVKLGNCYLKMQDFQSAKKIYKEALNKDSSLIQIKELINQLDKIIELGENGSE